MSVQRKWLRKGMILGVYFGKSPPFEYLGGEIFKVLSSKPHKWGTEKRGRYGRTHKIPVEAKKGNGVSVVSCDESGKPYSWANPEVIQLNRIVGTYKKAKAASDKKYKAQAKASVRREKVQAKSDRQVARLAKKYGLGLEGAPDANREKLKIGAATAYARFSEVEQFIVINLDFGQLEALIRFTVERTQTKDMGQTDDDLTKGS